MVLLLTLFRVIGAVALWQNDHEILAVVCGVLFIGGAGWNILFGLIAGLIPSRREAPPASSMTPLLDAVDYPEKPIHTIWVDDVRVRVPTAMASKRNGLWGGGDSTE